jgi:hypothetical protein
MRFQTRVEKKWLVRSYAALSACCMGRCPIPRLPKNATKRRNCDYDLTRWAIYPTLDS